MIFDNNNAHIKTEYSIYNVPGELLEKSFLNGNITYSKIKNLPAGLYIVLINYDKTTIKKTIILN